MDQQKAIDRQHGLEKQQKAVEEVENMRKQFESWNGRKLLLHYHDVLMCILKTEQGHTSAITKELAKQYVSLQQEILRRLDLEK